MRGEYKVLLPNVNEIAVVMSPKGLYAREWKRHWDNLLGICKSLKKSGTPYEVEYFLRVETPYALIFAGEAVHQRMLLAA